MALFLERLFHFRNRPFSNRQPGILEAGRGLVLEPIHRRHFKQWRTARECSRAFLQPKEPRWGRDETGFPSFLYRLRKEELARRQGKSKSYILKLRETDLLVGGISLFNIRRGAAQTATIGYWMREDQAGNGFMQLSVECICRHAFFELGLKRIEAAAMANNAASIRVLEKTGFEREGHARSYLQIDGRRQDHVLFSRLAPEGSDYP